MPRKQLDQADEAYKECLQFSLVGLKMTLQDMKSNTYTHELSTTEQHFYYPSQHDVQKKPWFMFIVVFWMAERL